MTALNAKKSIKMTKKSKDTASLSYEQAQQELQALLAQIEAQSIPLDALLAAYQRCQDLLTHCRRSTEASAAAYMAV